MYNGSKEFMVGGALLVTPELTLSKVAGGYLAIDGIIRFMSGPLQIYGIWSGNQQLENIPSNFLGLIGNVVDNISSDDVKYSTGGTGQLVGEMIGDIGLSRRRLYEAIMSPKGKTNLEKYIRQGKIINGIIAPARTGYGKGKEIEQNNRK